MKTFVLCLLLVAAAMGAPSGKPQFKRGLNKIVGGVPVHLGEIPFQVSLQDLTFSRSWHICGGSIISEDWVVTAAHCVDSYDRPDTLRIRAGVTDIGESVDNAATEQNIVPSKIVSHKDFDDYQHINDIALLQLSSSLSVNDYVMPVALPEPMQDSSGTAIVSGWGTIEDDGEWTPDILLAVPVPIVSDSECGDAYGHIHFRESMLCAGAEGRDSCKGDGGGPLTCTTGGSTYLCGVTSFGYHCGFPGHPGVYTEVSYFIEWIQENSGVGM